MHGENQKMNKTGKLAEIIRFIINGGISFLVDYGALYFLTEFLGVYYLLSSAISFSASVTVNYFICVFWVFEGAKNTSYKSKVIFVSSSVGGLLLNQLIMWVFVDKIGIYYMTAKILSTIIVMFWNFIMKRKALYL